MAHPFSICISWFPTIHGSSARIIPLDHSRLCGAPSFADLAKGGCFRCWCWCWCWCWFRFRSSFRVPRSTSNPSIHPAAQTLFPILINPVTTPRPVVRLPHRKQVNPLPPFANPAKDGAPKRAKTELRSNLHEWYNPHGSAVNCGNYRYTMGGPPACHDTPTSGVEMPVSRFAISENFMQDFQP